MSLTELQEALRRNVIETLQLISSCEEQLEYQCQVPTAFVTAELFCLWDDAYSEEFTDEKYFRSAFLQPELLALTEFNQVFERVLKSLSDSLPSIGEFVLTPESEQLSKAAFTALRAFEA